MVDSATETSLDTALDATDPLANPGEIDLSGLESLALSSDNADGTPVIANNSLSLPDQIADIVGDFTSAPGISEITDFVTNVPPDAVALGGIVNTKALPGLAKLKVFLLYPPVENTLGLVPNLATVPTVFFAFAGLPGTTSDVVLTLSPNGTVELGRGGALPLPANSAYFYNARGGRSPANDGSLAASFNFGVITSTVVDPVVDFVINGIDVALRTLARSLQALAAAGDLASGPTFVETLATILVTEASRATIVKSLTTATTFYAGPAWRGQELRAYSNGEITASISGFDIRIEEGQGPGGSGKPSSAFDIDVPRIAFNRDLDEAGGTVLDVVDSNGAINLDAQAAEPLAQVLLNSYIEGGQTVEDAYFWTRGAFENGGRSLLAQRALNVLSQNTPNSVLERSFREFGMGEEAAEVGKAIYDFLRSAGREPQEAWSTVWEFYILGTDLNGGRSGLIDGGFSGGLQSLEAVANFLSLSVDSGEPVLVASADLSGLGPLTQSTTAPTLPDVNPSYAGLLNVGGADDDLLIGTSAESAFNGGDGVDMATYLDADVGIDIDLNTALAQGSLTSIELVGGSNLDDTITGTDLADFLVGLGGNDTLNGGAGNDTIVGGITQEYFDRFESDFADAGFDIASLQTGSNIINAGAGNDTVYVSGADVVDAGEGDDRVVITVTPTLDADGKITDLNLPAGIDLDGGAGNDTLVIEFDTTETIAPSALSLDDLPPEITTNFENVEIGTRTYLPSISSSPEVDGAPQGWTKVNSNSPDVTDGAAPWEPYLSNISSGSPYGGTFGFFVTVDDFEYEEGFTTTLTGLEVGETYSFEFVWEGATWASGSNVYEGGQIKATVGGEEIIFDSNGAPGADAWQTETIVFTATGTEMDFSIQSNYEPGFQRAVVFDAPGAPDAAPDTNEIPTLSFNQTATELEYTLDNTAPVKVGEITVNDDGVGDNALYLTGSNADKFEIVGNEIFLKAGVELTPQILPQGGIDEQLNLTLNVDDSTIGFTPDDSLEIVIDLVFAPEPPGLTLTPSVGALELGSTVTDALKVADVAFDPASGATLSLAGADAGLFSLVGDELFLNAGTDLSFSDARTLDVTVQIDDPSFEGTVDETADFSISVQDNTAATDITLENLVTTFATGTTTTTSVKVADIVISDDGIGTNTLGLSGADASNFEIVGSELFIKAGTDLTNAASFDVEVTATDAALGTAPQITSSVAVSIATNAAPTAVSVVPELTEVAEDIDTTARVLIGTIVVEDDALGTNTFTLSGADADKFEIDNGVLYLKEGVELDFETQPALDVTITAADADLSSSTPVTTDFTLAVLDRNEAPTAVTVSSVPTSISEDTDLTAALKVGDIAITDDGLGTNQVTLGGADADLFEVVGSEIFLKAGTTLDFETQSNLEVIVQVDDVTAGGFIDATQTLSIAIGDVNEVPTGVVFNNPLAAVEVGTTLTADLKVADLAPLGDALGTNTYTLSGADAGAFNVVGSELFLNSGTDLSTAGSLTVTVEVDDALNGAGIDGSADFTLDITDNADPVVTLSNTVTSIGETADTTLATKIADIAITDDTLGTNEVTLEGADAALFEIVGDALFLKAGTVLTGGDDLDVSVKVKDVDAPEADASIVALTVEVEENTVAGVSFDNTVPLLATGTDTTAAVKVADITLTETDGGQGTNTLTLTGTDADKFEIVGNALFLKAGFDTSLATTAPLSVTVEVTDPSLAPTEVQTATFSLDVADNAAPTGFTATPSVSSLFETAAANGSVKVADLSIIDDGLGTNVITLTGGDVEFFEVIGDELFLKEGADLDFETQSSISVTLELADPSLSSSTPISRTLNFTVLDANDAPLGVVLSNALAGLPETTDTTNAIKVGDIAVEDDAQGNNILSLSGEDAGLFEIVGTELFLKAGTALDAATNPTLDVTIEVDDPTVGTAPDATLEIFFDVTV